MDGLKAVHSFLLHLLLGGIVHEGEAFVDEPFGVSPYALEVIGSEGDDVRLNPQLAQILQYGGLVLLFLLGRVRIIEPDYETSPIPPGVVVVEEYGLGMSDVEVAGGFGREAGDDRSGHRPSEGVHSLDQGVHLGPRLEASLGVVGHPHGELSRLADGGMRRHAIHPPLGSPRPKQGENLGRFVRPARESQRGVYGQIRQCHNAPCDVSVRRQGGVQGDAHGPGPPRRGEPGDRQGVIDPLIDRRGSRGRISSQEGRSIDGGPGPAPIKGSGEVSGDGEISRHLPPPVRQS